MTTEDLGRLTEQMAADVLDDLQPILEAARAEKRTAVEAAERAGRLLASIERLASGMRFGLEAIQTAREELEREQRPPTEEAP